MSKTSQIIRRQVSNIQTVDLPGQLPSRLKDPKNSKLYEQAREYARSKGFELVLSAAK